MQNEFTYTGKVWKNLPVIIKKAVNCEFDKALKWYNPMGIATRSSQLCDPVQPGCYLNCYSTIIYLHVRTADLHNRIVPLVQICGIIGARYTSPLCPFHYRKTRNNVIGTRREQTTITLAEISALPEVVVSFPAFCGHLAIWETVSSLSIFQCFKPVLFFHLLFFDPALSIRKFETIVFSTFCTRLRTSFSLSRYQLKNLEAKYSFSIISQLLTFLHNFVTSFLRPFRFYIID